MGHWKTKREFLYSEDAASLIIDLMEVSEKIIYKYTKGKFSHINIGFGEDYKISDLVKKLVKISGFRGKIIYNTNYPDGVKRKLLSIKLLKKICPSSFSNIIRKKSKFDYYIKKEYLNFSKETIKNLKKTAHIIYPFDLKKNINPWSIGNNLYYALKINTRLKNIYMDIFEKIYPERMIF